MVFLLVFLTLVILAWALWLAFILRYPDKWSRFVDHEHSTILRMGLSIPSISSFSQKYAKGMGIKIVLAVSILTMALAWALAIMVYWNT